MSEPDDRSRAGDEPHGSTASTGSPAPGQPLADQPTEVVHRPEPDPDWSAREETTVLPPAAPEDAGRGAAATSWWRPDDGTRPVPVAVHAPRHAAEQDDGTATQPQYRDGPVVVRRADTVAGLLLLLAGIAAGVSLLVVWVNGGATGLDLVRDGFDDLADDPQGLLDRDSWRPLAVVLGGAALFVLGLLLFVPARTHRFLGALALIVSLVVAAGVLVPLAEADWDLEAWAVGAWFAVAVGALGFLGAVKALMTHPLRR
jgi:hypothetical protein